MTLWLGPEVLSVKFAGDILARYEVEYCARTDRLREVKSARLFETAYRLNLVQPRLFGLEALGETGWLKALKLDGYAPRAPRGSDALQGALFPFLERTGG